MALNLPTLGRLEIISVTFGSKDYTSYVRDAFAKALALNPRIQRWAFSASTSFFGEDPNPNIRKFGAVVCRNTIPLQNEAWSTFKRSSADEGQNLPLKFSGQDDTVGQLPRVPELSQNATFVIAAFWWTQDVTSQAAAAVRNATYSPSKPTTITVGTSSLSSPAPSVPTAARRIFSWAYGLLTGVGWRFGVFVANPSVSDTADWTVELPVAFPPLGLPIYQSKCN